jgi:AraC-like DNA-binding protein
VTVTPQSEEVLQGGKLVDLIARQAVIEGPNHHEWPGLTFYRFDHRVTPSWEEVGSVSLCMVVQGRKRVRIGSTDYFYDPFRYLVMTRGLRFQAEVLQASPERPFLSFVLQMQPHLVTEVYDKMNSLVPEMFCGEPARPTPEAYVTALDQPLVGAVQRFLQALESVFERQVLAPMYLREIVYRLLWSEQRARLLESAAHEVQGNAVAAAIHYMRQEMQQPLTVQDMARAVCMSESAFAHAFKGTTGTSPMRFLKQLRMEQASKLLLNGTNVSEAADQVGYTSLSHFISEFKRYFGTPPKTYVQRLLHLQAADARDALSHS